MTTMTADRTMRARWATLCPICCQPIKIGQKIARSNGVWQHERHITEPMLTKEASQ